jgi:ABC transporter substrate binding protein
MRRREFLGVLGGAAAWPAAAQAQQPAMPVIGFFRSGEAKGGAPLQAAFLRGLKDAGFVDGKNVAVEYRWSDDRPERLPALAGELIARRVAVIVANQSAALAAKAASSTVPVVFVTGADPISAGLVASMNRPGGNVTGIVFTTGDLTGKRLGLLRELVPNAPEWGRWWTRTVPPWRNCYEERKRRVAPSASESRLPRRPARRSWTPHSQRLSAQAPAGCWSGVEDFCSGRWSESLRSPPATGCPRPIRHESGSRPAA